MLLTLQLPANGPEMKHNSHPNSPFPREFTKRTLEEATDQFFEKGEVCTPPSDSCGARGPERTDADPDEGQWFAGSYF